MLNFFSPSFLSVVNPKIDWFDFLSFLFSPPSVFPSLSYVSFRSFLALGQIQGWSHILPFTSLHSVLLHLFFSIFSRFVVPRKIFFWASWNQFFFHFPPVAELFLLWIFP